MKRFYLFIVCISLFILSSCAASNNGIDHSELTSTKLSDEEEQLLSMLGDPFFLFDMNIIDKEEKELVIFADHYIDGKKQANPTMLSTMITNESKVKMAIFQRKVANKCQWVSAILSNGGSSILEQEPTTCKESSDDEHITSIHESDPIDIAIGDEIVIATYHTSDQLDNAGVHISLSDQQSDIPNNGDTYIIKAMSKTYLEE